MANEGHLKILKKGVEVWNKWREENPDIIPDLTGAKLSEADLLGADLQVADIRNAELRKSLLCGANLKEAKLNKADLREADIGGADLSSSDLCEADITGINLGIDLDSINHIFWKIYGVKCEYVIFGAEGKKERFPKVGNFGPADFERIHSKEEHLKILKQDIAKWNEWRKMHPYVSPDLCGTDLSNWNLYEADLSHAFLLGTDLHNANLSETNLYHADLFEANLSGADLSSANLQGADLSETNISKASLSEAHLLGTYLCDADLRSVDLRMANLQWTRAWNSNFKDADLSGANLKEADLSEANLQCAILSETNLEKAKLREANLEIAYLDKANLTKADLRGANLHNANFNEANLSFTDLSYSDLRYTSFISAILIGSNLKGADLSNSQIFGISAWKLETNKQTKQSNLVITPIFEPTISVDNLEVAQFIYLLLNRKKLRNVIDTITSKSVLILGRFTPERKAVLDAMANELRRHNLLPIIFDFERASSRDFTETIKTLAGMSLFVIADITNPSSAPLELQAIVPDYQIPFVPIIQEGEKPFAMFRDLKTKYSWVLPILPYSSSEILIKIFKRAIIDEAFEMHKKLLKSKAEAMETRSAEDYLKESE